MEEIEELTATMVIESTIKRLDLERAAAGELLIRSEALWDLHNRYGWSPGRIARWAQQKLTDRGFTLDEQLGMGLSADRIRQFTDLVARPA